MNFMGESTSAFSYANGYVIVILGNVLQEMRKGMFILFSLLYGVGVFAQNTDELRDAYEKDKRDVKAVTEYVRALGETQKRAQADSVVREYMARCPVVQLEDKDTYLLINKFVFEDVYSNAFEYGIFMQRKMHWDREAKNDEVGEKARLLSLLRGMQGSISNADEIDKRYEVLSVLSGNLRKEVDKRCLPAYTGDKYVMPGYDSLKIAHLKYLLQKGDLLGQEIMQLKIGVYEDYVAGNYAGMVEKLNLACGMNFKKLDENYTVQILSVLADTGVNREVLKSGIDLLNRLIEKKKESADNYYNVLGRYYLLYGDEERGNRYKLEGERVEAQKRARLGDLMNAFEK